MLQMLRSIEEKDAPASREAQRALKDYPTAREDAIHMINHLKTMSRVNFGRLYRGVEAEPGYEEGIKNLKPGHEFELPVSSFSKDITTAKIHATKWSPGKKPYMFILDGPVKAIDTAGISLVPSEAEVIAKDKFVVDKVEGNSIYIHTK